MSFLAIAFAVMCTVALTGSVILLIGIGSDISVDRKWDRSYTVRSAVAVGLTLIGFAIGAASAYTFYLDNQQEMQTLIQLKS